MINNSSQEFKLYDEPLGNPEVLTIEKFFSLSILQQWFAENWIWLMYLGMACFIGIAQKIVKNRTQFEICNPLTIWNIGLALFSLIGTFRIVDELFHILGKDGGLYASICLWNDFNVAATVWGCLFVLSKAMELGDTVFIVIRNQKLLFLHWFHYITVLCYTWYTFAANPVTSRWFGGMNYAVHTLMYSDYAIKSLKLHVPRNIATIITTSQIIQILIGISINLYSFYQKSIGAYCVVEMENLVVALLFYFSYLYFFAKFIHDTYSNDHNNFQLVSPMSFPIPQPIPTPRQSTRASRRRTTGMLAITQTPRSSTRQRKAPNRYGEWTQ